VRAQLAGETDFAGFRAQARSLLARQVPPDQVQWATSAHDGDLFSQEPAMEGAAAPAAAPAPVPAAFLALCESVVLHSEPQRFALLYRLLWRLQHEPALRHDPLDADMLLARRLAHEVSHDIHKMRAFVRFREVPDPDAPGQVLHVAWFEPAHHIVEANAPWFMRRFTQMRWAILTPQRCVAWDGRELQLRPGAQRSDAPPADAGEQLWLTYYQSIFNPARLKLATMQKEMPRRYWRNLPEAQFISPLAARAAERSGGMIEQAASQTRRRVVRLERPQVLPVPTERPASLPDLDRVVQACRDCPIGALATQGVCGQGPLQPALMLVGEQPGDQEDLRGQPFVGPAGQLLARAMDRVGLSREDVFLTNAVRHFKYELRGKRRIHKTPSQAEAAACQHWLQEEIAIVQPRALVALGATAARSLLRRPVAVTAERGRWHEAPGGRRVLVTLHPSALLRMEPALQQEAFEAFVADLQVATKAGFQPKNSRPADRF
jgi:probable DNA metabolism protein